MPGHFQDRLQERLVVYTRFIIRHPFAVIGLTLLATLLLGTQLRYLHINYDPDEALPPNHPLIISDNKIAKTFGGKFISAIALEVKEGDIFNPATLGKLQRITEKIREIPGIQTVNLLSLSSPSLKAILGTPDGMHVMKMMPAVPVKAEEITALKSRVAQNADLLENLLVSKNKKMATILSDYESMKSMGGAGELNKTWETILQPERDANTSFHITGLPVMLHWMDVYSGRMAMLLPLAIIVIGLLHFHAFRTLQGLVIPLLTALMSVVWALGLLGFCRANLDPYNMVTPILVLAVAAGHSVQILKRYYEEFHRLQDNREAVVMATSRVGVAMLTAGFVAAAGLASLVTFQAATIRNFGFFASFGILSALFLEMTFIPALRSLLRPPTLHQAAKEQEKTVFDSFLRNIRGWMAKGRTHQILGAALLLLALSLAGAARLKINNSFSAYFPKHSTVMNDLNAINNNLGGAFMLQVMVEGGQDEIFKNPEVLKKIEGLQHFIDGLPLVGRTLSLVNYLKKMNQSMHDNNPAFGRIPDTRELTAQYLLLYSVSGDSGDLDRLVDFAYRRGVINVFVKDDDYELAKGILASIRGYFAQNLAPLGLRLSFGGGFSDSIAASEVVIHGKIVNIVQVGGMIFLVSCLVFHSWLAGLLVVLPLILTVCLNLAVMGISGIWLNMATATISAVALSMGADYGIYYLFRWREELQRGRSWSKTFQITESSSGKAILYVATAITLGYAITVLSGFTVHVYLGILVPLTMAFSSLCALTLLPALLLKIKPGFLKSQTTIREDTNHAGE